MATPIRPHARVKDKYTVPIKLWVSPPMYEVLAAEAERREWSVPQLIRWCIRDLMDRRFET